MIRRIVRTGWAAVFVAGMLTLGGQAAQATPVVDTVGDFLSIYTGTKGADLDILVADVIYDGTNITVYGKMNGAIGTTTGGFYVWGLNRGKGTANFTTAGLPGVLFDSVVVVNLAAANPLVVRDTSNAVTTNLTAANIKVNGNEISATFSKNLLPLLTGGFSSYEQYTYNLWSRNSTIIGNAALADFAPDNSNLLVSSVPEPSTIALVGIALAGIGLRRLRRRPV